ncbi:hypothetical protein [Fonticella tunisiensis]|uniref:Uncharacterized protein n=1 Tax=Fonticella tunisiensis TaxID=1096341 RepID=A0A4V3ETH2_9CLOT|nr:hypothetical protein [Fonticella tunisiensis]TDT61889.1 hypothetical protein EDD71_10567 [Fonticella tunisiensis]
MIQIDDAGSGSLIGGTLIGMMRVETRDFYYDVIPVKYFTTPYFEQKKFEDYCIKIIYEGLSNLKVDESEPIEICQGYMFNAARSLLKEGGYNIISTKISEPLQSVIEETFMDYIIGIGVPLDYLQFTKYPFHFHRMLKWVLADLKNREKLCKTAWRSWKKYGSVATHHYYDYLMGGTYRCMKCGNYIEVPGKIKVIKFTTNRDYYIYLHPHCSSSQ